MSEPYRFGGVDWSLPYPTCCETSDRLILEEAQKSTPFRRIPTGEMHTLLRPPNSGMKIGWNR